MTGILLGVGMTLAFLSAGTGYCFYRGWLQKAADYISNSSLSVSRRKTAQHVRELQRLAAGIQSVANRFSWGVDGSNPVADDIDNLGSERHGRIREILDLVDEMEQEIAILKQNCRNIAIRSGNYGYREVAVPAGGSAARPSQTPIQDPDDIEDQRYYWVCMNGETRLVMNENGKPRKVTGREIRRVFIEQNGKKLGVDFFVVEVPSVDRSQTIF